jgi:hypothetical protein
MGRMKDLHITIHNGGDKAVSAFELLSNGWREQLEQAASEIERLRLTDAERKAIASAIEWCEDITYGGPNDEEAAATLRALLKRTTL